MTPIERAARAMYDEISPDWDWDDPDAELLRIMYRANARAAFVSLRVATDTMCRVGRDHAGKIDPASIDRIWTVMMDAALTEGE